MRYQDFPGLARPASVLGMGCASLGSRIDRRTGLRALEEAYDAGVRWFDVAPAYGAGMAEDILGPFLAAHGAEAAVCTKVGLAPPKTGLLKSVALTAGRQVSGLIKPLKARLRGTKMLANRHMPLTPELITTSIETSLSRLGRERIDVYALHNAAPDDLEKDDIRQALDQVLASGKAGLISVASDLAAAETALRIGAPYGAVQIGLTLDTDSLAIIEAANARGVGVITHSVFGVSGSLETLTGIVAAHPELAAELEARGAGGALRAEVARLLLERALAVNPAGVTLASMFSAESRAMNLDVASRPIDPTSVDLVGRIVAAGAGQGTAGAAAR